jgi:hypothetical protein
MHSCKRCTVWIAFAALICHTGCGKRESLAKPEPSIKRVAVDSDLSRVLDINLVKYEYDVSGLARREDKLVYYKIWMELLRDDERIREWSTPNITCGDSGSILLAYYKPPLFTNEEETIKAKVIETGQGDSSMNISLDMPFQIQAQIGGIHEETIEIDREYILAKIVEMYSPHIKGAIHHDRSPDQDRSENKALILKVRFGMIEE